MWAFVARRLGRGAAAAAAASAAFCSWAAREADEWRFLEMAAAAAAAALLELLDLNEEVAPVDAADDKVDEDDAGRPIWLLAGWRGHEHLGPARWQWFKLGLIGSGQVWSS